MTRLLHVHARGTGSRFLRHAFAILLLAGTAVAGNALAATYRVVVLPSPVGPGSSAGAVDINAAGEIVGTYSYNQTGEPSYSYPMVWSPPDYIGRALPPSAEGEVAYLATRISDNGVIIGEGYGASGVMWTTDDSPFVYMAPDYQEYYDNHVKDINALGTAVGYIGLTPGGPALWTDPLTYTVLNAPNIRTPYALNDSDTIVGSASFGLRLHGFRRTPDGNMEDLGDLPGGKNKSIAYDVNNSGQIVGAGNSDVGQRAVLWDADNTIHDLGNLPNSPDVQYSANRINNFGEVIGSISKKKKGFVPCCGSWLWTADTGMLPIASLIDPNDPLYGAGTFTVYGLNDAGMLVGGLYPTRGSGLGTEGIAILLVPEP